MKYRTSNAKDFVHLLIWLHKFSRAVVQSKIMAIKLTVIGGSDYGLFAIGFYHLSVHHER